jgi:hypothetical protein
MKSFSKIINLVKDQRICVINMPVSYRDELSEIPDGVVVTTRPIGKFDKVILFTNLIEELETSWDRLFAVLNLKGDLIICYPEKKSEIYNEIEKIKIEEMSLAKNGTFEKEIKIIPGWRGMVINF